MLTPVVIPHVLCHRVALFHNALYSRKFPALCDSGAAFGQNVSLVTVRISLSLVQDDWQRHASIQSTEELGCAPSLHTVLSLTVSDARTTDDNGDDDGHSDVLYSWLCNVQIVLLAVRKHSSSVLTVWAKRRAWNRRGTRLNWVISQRSMFGVHRWGRSVYLAVHSRYTGRGASLCSLWCRNLTHYMSSLVRRSSSDTDYFTNEAFLQEYDEHAGQKSQTLDDFIWTASANVLVIWSDISKI